MENELREWEKKANKQINAPRIYRAKKLTAAKKPLMKINRQKTRKMFRKRANVTNATIGR